MPSPSFINQYCSFCERETLHELQQDNTYKCFEHDYIQILSPEEEKQFFEMFRELKQ